MSIQMAEMLQVLIKQNGLLLERYDPEDGIIIFDGIPPELPYHYLSKELTDLWSALNQDFGEEGFDAFQKITMLHLIDKFEIRSLGKRYSESIRERFMISFKRIAQSINDETFSKYRNRNDILLKDLAICRQKAFPAGGARVVEPRSGFPRSLMVRGGLNQGLRVLNLLIKLWGNKPFYSHHTHLSELEEFNPADFTRCNLRLADMLKLSPEIKGVHCGSWLYDPALETVSPHLSYMRELQQDNGALVFFAGTSIESGALAKSKTRRTLYEQGMYIPKSYHIIWPRQLLIDWADNASQSFDGERAGHSASRG